MAPTVTAAAKSRTTTARPKKGLTAKCAENQANLDILVEKRGQLRPTDKFSFTMKRAIESLQKSKEPVTSYAEALKLSYVGPTTASMIFSDRLDEGEASAAPRPRKRKAKKPNDTTTASSNSPNASPSTKRAPESSGAPVAAKRRRHRDSLGAGEASRLLRSAIAEKPTAKEVAYTNAVSQAENYIGKKLTWRAILLVDGREKKSEHMRAKCEMSGIPSEERMLPIGDMAWIGQGIDPQSKKVVSELMLGTIIERKTTEDLKSSLFGTRYWEQRLRLQHSGIPQVLFLIEGDLTKELFNCPAETLHTAVMETRLHLGFQIVQTEHMAGTVAALKSMHRRILQRSFPHAFGRAQEALPTFAEAGAAGVRRRESFPPQDHHRRRRRRLQSLMEMTFDSEPVPPLGESRFVTYKELKAKVERDREAGKQTIGGIHAAMLKQVATISGKKVQALTRAYQTTGHLLQAFSDEPDEDARKAMVTDLPTHEPGQATARVLKVGPRSAAELYVAYGMHYDDDESEASVTGRPASYSELFEQTQAKQRLSLSSQKETASAATAQVSRTKTKTLDKQRLSLSPQEYTGCASLNVSHSFSALPSIHDDAFWDEDDDNDDRSISEFLPTASSNNKTKTPDKQRLSLSPQEYTGCASLNVSHSSSVLPSIHDDALWDEDEDDDNRSISEFLPTANSNNKSKIPDKQRLSLSSPEDTGVASRYVSHSSSVLRETTVASSVARAKPSIRDDVSWDDDDDDDRSQSEFLPTAKNNMSNKASLSYSYPGSKENLCVDLTDSTPRKKPALSSIVASLDDTLDSSDADDTIFLERQSKQKPAPRLSSILASLDDTLDSSSNDEDIMVLERQSRKQKQSDKRLSFSSSSTTSTSTTTAVRTTTITTKNLRNAQEVIEID